MSIIESSSEERDLSPEELSALFSTGEDSSLLEFCEEAHPKTVAELLMELGDARLWHILRILPTAKRVEVFSYLELDRQVDLVSGESRSDMALLIEEMAPDDRADLVQQLDETVREEILPLIARAEREDIRRLVSYDENSAGSVMSTDYATLKPGALCSEALEQLRHQATVKETIYYVYVVNDAHQLIGFVSLKDLILGKPTQSINDLMHEDVLAISVDDDKEEAARTIKRYGFIAIPVVGENKLLLGIITHDDAMEVLGEEETEDMLAFGGITTNPEVDSNPYWQSRILSVVKRRLHWLFVLFFAESITGSVLRHYQWMEIKFPDLGLFIPLLIGTGGNAGSQTVSTVIRGIALGEIESAQLGWVLLRELSIGIFLGVLLGTAGFCYAHFFRETEFPFSIVIGLTIGGICIWANSIGSLIPLVARRVGIDPAVVSAPLISTLVDATGLVIYYSIARVVLIHLAN